MKRYARRTLALLLSLVLCLGLLPTGALAAGSSGGGDWPSVTITGTPTLTGGSSPKLTVNWFILSHRCEQLCCRGLCLDGNTNQQWCSAGGRMVYDRDL